MGEKLKVGVLVALVLIALFNIIFFFPFNANSRTEVPITSSLPKIIDSTELANIPVYNLNEAELMNGSLLSIPGLSEVILSLDNQYKLLLDFNGSSLVVSSDSLDRDLNLDAGISKTLDLNSDSFDELNLTFSAVVVNMGNSSDRMAKVYFKTISMDEGYAGVFNSIKILQNRTKNEGYLIFFISLVLLLSLGIYLYVAYFLPRYETRKVAEKVDNDELVVILMADLKRFIKEKNNKKAKQVYDRIVNLTKYLKKSERNNLQKELASLERYIN